MRIRNQKRKEVSSGKWREEEEGEGEGGGEGREDSFNFFGFSFVSERWRGCHKIYFFFLIYFLIFY